MKEVLKIEKIDIRNIKAIGEFHAFFGGKGSHITGANGKGKSTALRVLTDHIKGFDPAKIVKHGEEEGCYLMEMTNGSKLRWDVNSTGKNVLFYYPANSLKPASGKFLREFIKDYFPNDFDMQLFLTTTQPQKRLKMIEELTGLDFTKVRAYYDKVYAIRKSTKKELDILQAQKLIQPDEIIFEDFEDKELNKKLEKLKEELNVISDSEKIERELLNKKYTANSQKNKKSQAEHEAKYQTQLDSWEKEEAQIKAGFEAFNAIQEEKGEYREKAKELLTKLYNLHTEIEKELNFKGDYEYYKQFNEFVSKIPEPFDSLVYEQSKRPEKTPLELPDPMPSTESLNIITSKKEEIEGEIIGIEKNIEENSEKVNEQKAAKIVYDKQLQIYQDAISEIEEKQKEVEECENAVFDALEKVKELVATADLPTEFSIDLENKNDILFRASEDEEYLPITTETLASSAIYIATFKLEMMRRTNFRVVTFDVSFLDYINRKKVKEEAENMGIQLLTESAALSEKQLELQIVDA